MRYRLIHGLLVLAAVAYEAGGGPPEQAPANKGPVWLDDYAAARQAARRSGKPIFAVFR